MRIRIAVVACVALTASLLALVAGAQGRAQAAKTHACGSVPNRGGVGGPGIVPGEKFFFRVTVVKGNTSCKTAKSVISRYSAQGKSPAGWSCTNTNPTHCTKGKNEVDGKFYGVKPKTG